MDGSVTETRALGADGQKTTCCIVGGGPAGAMLGLLLARQGVDVTLLEAHHNFDRDFRGDTVHPSTLAALGQIGLAEGLLTKPHSRMSDFALQTPQGAVTFGHFSGLKTPYPFVALMPQVHFIEYLVEQAGAYPNFHLRLNCRANDLIEAGGRVVGVRGHHEESEFALRADLVVAADGRFSKLRQLAGFEPVREQTAMDVLWFRLDRPKGVDLAEGIFIGAGQMLVALERIDQWQFGYVIKKGGYQALHQAGIAELRRHVGELVPALRGPLEGLTDWHEVSLLSVEANRLPLWHKPGLLFIGDAAHTMSPVGGVGINYAIQDALATANLLTAKLLAGKVDDADLAAVQKRREWPTRVIQAFQRRITNGIVGPALGQGAFKVPFLARIPMARAFVARIVGLGARPEHVAPEWVEARAARKAA